MVGDHPSLFIVTVVSTMVTKILFLVLALALAFSGYQQNLFPHPTILWCEEEWSSKTLTKSLRGDITLCSFDSTSTGLAPCFELSPIESGVQKVRVCSSEEEELVLKISLLFVVVFLNCLSLGAALWLNKIVDYVELFKATKKLLWFIPIKPVIHRSALHKLVKSNNEEDLDLLKEMLQVKDIGAVTNRPNREGKTALDLALQNNQQYTLQPGSLVRGPWLYTLMLWAAGAKPLQGQIKALFYYPILSTANLKPRGIQHLVECSALAKTDLTNKKAAEQKITELATRSGFKVVFVPPFNLTAGEKTELRKYADEWNRANQVKGTW